VDELDEKMRAKSPMRRAHFLFAVLRNDVSNMTAYPAKRTAYFILAVAIVRGLRALPLTYRIGMVANARWVSGTDLSG
jgi:hypothetical protein